jgi:uncharacterized protein YbjQ (UPF0145 family)
MPAGIRDIVGGRSGAYEKALREAREIALAEMQDEAAQFGRQGDAVIGVNLDYDMSNRWQAVLDADGFGIRHRRRS